MRDTEIRPITWREAAAYVDANHRHHTASRGCKFCLSLWHDGVMHGVAMCGRPVARKLDDGFTLEINRLCTDGIPNGCSMLYGASVRVAKAMGYKKVITYILESENGASLKASNFVCTESRCGGKEWTGNRGTGKNVPHEMKSKWEYVLRT